MSHFRGSFSLQYIQQKNPDYAKINVTQNLVVQRNYIYTKILTKDIIYTLLLESIKTTSMEDVSTRVLEKIKNI